MPARAFLWLRSYVASRRSLNSLFGDPPKGSRNMYQVLLFILLHIQTVSGTTLNMLGCILFETFYCTLHITYYRYQQ